MGPYHGPLGLLGGFYILQVYKDPRVKGPYQGPMVSTLEIRFRAQGSGCCFVEAVFRRVEPCFCEYRSREPFPTGPCSFIIYKWAPK